MNISRRLFLLSGISVIQPFWPVQAIARGKQKAVKSGIRSIAKQDWAPAIAPDRVTLLDKGLSCFTDPYGRLAIVDLRHKEDASRVLGQLNLQSKRVIDFAAVRQRAYALTSHETQNGETSFFLTTISLAPANEPTIVSRLPLSNYNDASCLTATADFICVGGIAAGTNTVSVLAARGKSAEPVLISSLQVDAPVTALDLQGRLLVILENGSACQIDYVDLFFPQKPQLRKTMKLDGNFFVMARSKDIVLVAGQPSSSKSLEARTILLEPAPHVVQSESLQNFSAVHCATAQRDRFYLVGEHNGDRQLVDYAMTRELRLVAEHEVKLPQGKAPPGANSGVSVQGRLANVASGWHGIDVLSLEKDGWQSAFNYSIPRFPASSVACWQDLVLLAGADYDLYDISRPERPVLKETLPSVGPVKSVATAGAYLLSLSKKTLCLRRLDKLTEILCQISVDGQDMAFDSQSQKAYVLLAKDKSTTVTPVQAYSNKLVAGPPFDVPAGLRRIIAHNGTLLLCGMTELALYNTAPDARLLSKYSLDGFAIRDAYMQDELIVVSAVDHSSKGFLFTIAREGNQLSRSGAISLPQDGVAVTMSGKQAVAVGKNPQGQDLASVIDLSSPALPNILASFPSVEASSAVIIKDKLAFVVGRGLAIISLG